MPKATKKKKDKDADFTVRWLFLGGSISVPCWRTSPQKAKLKLGKGKKAPSNATDTSFKARCEGIAIDPSSDIADGDSHS
jgi:pre-rRNA-processing protein IPI1